MAVEAARGAPSDARLEASEQEEDVEDSCRGGGGAGVEEKEGAANGTEREHAEADQQVRG